MCGIFGYVGYRQAASILLAGLKELEYRGYDSYGIATASTTLHLEKHVGKISDRITGCTSLKGTIGIGHTRWATHGIPNEQNAHPHADCTGHLAVVHNGIITNHAILRRELIARGHEFASDTDTEVVSHLLEEAYHGDLLNAMRAVLPRLEGTYALLALADTSPSLVAARQKSPLVIGIGDRELVTASDLTPLLDHTDRVLFLEDGDVASLSPTGLEVYHGTTRVERPVEQIEWQKEAVHKRGFAHFMLKEIFEQPAVFHQTLTALDSDQIAASFHRSGPITILACGTSYHAGLIARYLLEEYAGAMVRVELASEFKYHPSPLQGLAIAVTQSGETADTNAALGVAKSHNMKTLAITNVQGSSITRLADHVLFTRAGPELSVAATKSFTAQLAVFLQVVNTLQDRTLNPVLRKAHQSIGRALLTDVSPAVARCRDAHHLFFIGRGPLFPVALEGALKMKEISYIHAEAYAAGELKHGPFALLTAETPVIAICTRDTTHDVMLANIKEVTARGAPVIALGQRGDQELEEVADVFLPLQCGHTLHHILEATTILQLLAYHTANALHREIDRPRNLAKSVTVE